MAAGLLQVRSSFEELGAGIPVTETAVASVLPEEAELYFASSDALKCSTQWQRYHGVLSHACTTSVLPPADYGMSHSWLVTKPMKVAVCLLLSTYMSVLATYVEMGATYLHVGTLLATQLEGGRFSCGWIHR